MFETRVKLDDMLTGVINDDANIKGITEYILKEFSDGSWCEIMNLITIHSCIFLDKIQIYAKIVRRLLEENYFNLVEFYTVGKRLRSFRLLYYLHKNGATSVKQLLEIYKIHPILLKYFPYLNGIDPSDDVPTEIDFLVENIFDKGDVLYEIYHGQPPTFLENNENKENESKSTDYDLFGFIINSYLINDFESINSDNYFPNDDESIINNKNIYKFRIDKNPSKKIKQNPYLELPDYICSLNVIIQYFGSPEINKKNIIAAEVYNRTIKEGIDTYNHIRFDKVVESLNYRAILNYTQSKDIVIKSDLWRQANIPTSDSLPIYLYFKELGNIIPMCNLAFEGANRILEFLWQKKEVFNIDSVFNSSINGNNLPIIKKLEKYADTTKIDLTKVAKSQNVDLLKYFHEKRYMQFMPDDDFDCKNEAIYAYAIENDPNFVVNDMNELIRIVISDRQVLVLEALKKRFELDKSYVPFPVEYTLIELAGKCDWYGLKIAADAGLKCRFRRCPNSVIVRASEVGDLDTIVQAVRLSRWNEKNTEKVAQYVEKVSPELAEKIRSGEINGSKRHDIRLS